MNDQETPLALSIEHAKACHQRWIKLRSNWYSVAEGDDDRPDEWYNEQCGQCRFYVLLRGKGALKSDWGVCSNQTSPFDGNVKFEHDGCQHYLGANAWISEYFLPYSENEFNSYSENE